MARLRFAVGILLGGLLTATAQAVGLDVRLGNETAELDYLFVDDARIGTGGLDVHAGLFINEDDDVAALGGFMVTGNALGRSRSLQLGAGVRAYAAALDCEDNPQPCGEQDRVSALAVGGRLSWVLPAYTPMALIGELFYAPQITSFSDNRNLLDFALRFELELAPGARLYLGYRLIEAELDPTGLDYELEDGAHLGLRFSF